MRRSIVPAVLVFVLTLLAAATVASAEGVPLLSLRGTSLGIGPNYEWSERVEGIDPRQFTLGLYGAKVLFDGPADGTGIGSAALVGSFVYGVDNKELKYTIGGRIRLWNHR